MRHVSAFMPTHIKRGRERKGKTSLASSALSYLICYGYAVNADGAITARPRKDITSRSFLIKDLVASGEDVDLNAFGNLDQKTRNALKAYLKRYKYKNHGNGIYKLQTEVTE